MKREARRVDADYLREVRRTRGLTQRALAELLGWTRSRVAGLENRHCDLSLAEARTVVLYVPEVVCPCCGGGGEGLPAALRRLADRLEGA